MDENIALTDLSVQCASQETTGDGEVTATVTALRAFYWLTCRKKWIFRSVAAASVLGVIVSVVLPNRYVSETRLMPPKQSQPSVSMLNNLPAVGSLGEVASGGLSLKDPNAIYIGILNSRPIADRLIARFDLQKLFRQRDMTATRKQLKEETRVISENSGLISITVNDRNKQLASDICNAYTQELRDLSKTIAFTEASRRRLFFEEQLNHAKNELVTSEAGFSKIQHDKTMVRPDAQAIALVGNISSLRAQIAAKQVELQALRSYATERNPDLQIAEQELSTLQSEATRLDHGATTSEFSEMGLEGVSQAGLDYLRAQRDLQYKETFFQLLLKQYEAAQLDEAKDPMVIQTVETAIPADRKASPHRLAIVILFALMGFAGAVSYLGLAESMRANPSAMQAWKQISVALGRG